MLFLKIVKMRTKSLQSLIIFSIEGGKMFHRICSTAVVALGVMFTMSFAQPYTLTATADNGTITLDPATGPYESGTSVTVTVAANAGYVFSKWSGDLSGTENPTVMVMDADKSITANFLEIPTGYCEAAGGAGTGGDFIASVAFADLKHLSEPHAIPSVAGQNYSDYTAFAANITTGQPYYITVALLGSFKPDRTFAWIDFNRDGAFDASEIVLAADFSASSNEATASVYIPQSATGGATRMRVRVQYALGADGEPCGDIYCGDVEDYTVIIEKGPTLPIYTLTQTSSNGSVTVKPELAQYDSGQVVQLKATPELGYAFSAWSGDNTSTDNPLDLIMTQNMTITAVFTTTPICTVTVLTDVSKGYIILSPDGGIYNQGATITATVSSAYGYLFTNWKGDFTGTERSITLQLDKNISIDADFIEGPTCYSEASGLSGTGGDYINNVSFGEIAQSTERVPNSGEFYSDYTMDFATVERGQVVPLNVSAKSVFPPDRIFAWIDWNADCLFEANEMVLTTGANLTSTSASADVTVPADAVFGMTRMRVRIQYDSLADGDPYSKNFFGDVQDFSIVVRDPTSVRPGAIAGKAIQVSAIRPSGKNGFVIAGRPDTRYSVFDISGKMITNGVTAMTNERVDLNRFKRGLYIVKVVSSGRSIVQKMIVR